MFRIKQFFAIISVIYTFKRSRYPAVKKKDEQNRFYTKYIFYFHDVYFIVIFFQ